MRGEKRRDDEPRAMSSEERAVFETARATVDAWKKYGAGFAHALAVKQLEVALASADAKAKRTERGF